MSIYANRTYPDFKVSAEPRTQQEHYKRNGWALPAFLRGTEDEDGYFVEVVHTGQGPWISKKDFNKKYRLDRQDLGHGLGLTFGEALEALKDGCCVARTGWNGKGMFLFLVKGSTFEVNKAPLLGIYPEGTKVEYHTHIDMKTAQGYVIPWLASQADVLAEDWEIT